MKRSSEDWTDLIRGVQSGNADDVHELMFRFKGLIFTIARKLYFRYGGLIPMDEVVAEVMSAALFVVATKYRAKEETERYARLPQFVKRWAEARAVQILRPQYKYRKRSEPLHDVFVIDPREAADTSEIMAELSRYAKNHFTRRERSLIKGKTNSRTATDMARELRISRVRVSFILKRCFTSMRRHLATHGICRISDIY